MTNEAKFHLIEEIDLVPASSFRINVRSQVSHSAWDWLRKETYKQAGYSCESCGEGGSLDAHEIWKYDDDALIQKLDGLVCLCKSCHLCCHLGFASVNGKLGQAKAHLAKLSGKPKHEIEAIVSAAFLKWKVRSEFEWKLDLSFLDECGIPYFDPKTTKSNPRKTSSFP